MADLQDMLFGETRHAAKLDEKKPKADDRRPAGQEDAEDLGFCASLARGGALYGLGVQKPGVPDQIVEYYDVEIVADNTHLKMVTGSRKIWMLELRGRNLLKLAYHLKEHRIEYVRQAIRDDFAAEKIYIEKLTFEDVTERVRTRDPIVIEIVGLPPGAGARAK